MKILKKKLFIICLLIFIILVLLFFSYFYWLLCLDKKTSLFFFKCDSNIFFFNSLKYQEQINSFFILDIIEDFKEYFSLPVRVQIDGLLTAMIVPFSFHFFLELGLIDLFLDWFFS